MSEFTNEYFNKGEHFIGAQFGTELVSGGDTYTGYFLNGLKHGYGILQYSSGDILEGIGKKALLMKQSLLTLGKVDQNMLEDLKMTR